MEKKYWTAQVKMFGWNYRRSERPDIKEWLLTVGNRTAWRKFQKEAKA